MIPYFDLFRFASTKDKFLMVIGSIAAFLNGGAIPSFSLIFGSMINSFQEAGDEMVR
jgi:ATP-binding cassette subfamily B (MDR/TAP) protein 1